MFRGFQQSPVGQTSKVLVTAMSILPCHRYHIVNARGEQRHSIRERISSTVQPPSVRTEVRAYIQYTHLYHERSPSQHHKYSRGTSIPTSTISLSPSASQSAVVLDAKKENGSPAGKKKKNVQNLPITAWHSVRSITEYTYQPVL